MEMISFLILYIAYYLKGLVREGDEGNTFQAMIEATRTIQLTVETTYTEQEFMKGLEKVAAGCLCRLLGVWCS